MLSESTLERLGSSISRGEVVLFLGAGFSVAAKDHAGKALPDVDDLRRELWDLGFPGRDLDGSALGDVFDIARRRNPKKTETLLEERLSTDPATLPDFYETYFSFPWLRCYTLNVDDLPVAVQTRFRLPRRIEFISATGPVNDDPEHRRDDVLQVVCLNGNITGSLDSLTFSEVDYAKRLAGKERWYTRCVADLRTRPVIFVGTELRESPLWTHIERRKQGKPSGGARDLRPKGILVAKALTAAREEVLKDLRVEWQPATAESFAVEVLEPMRPQAKQGLLQLEESLKRRGLVDLPLVSDLAAERPRVETEYLMGEEPTWADILTRRAIIRSDDGIALQQAEEILNGRRKDTLLALIGTAGTGKSTALMRLALHFSNDGVPVYWIDRTSEAPTAFIRSRIQDAEGPVVLAVDDADLLGRSLIQLARGLVPSKTKFLFAIAMRSSKVDEIARPLGQGGQVKLLEHTIPALSDDDIEGLISTLDVHHRLGELKGKKDSERRSTFRNLCGRQLLVAMIEATSGEKFDEKVFKELDELQGVQKYVYGLVCLATARRFPIYKEEVALASGDDGTAALAALDTLARRHLIFERPPGPTYQARHRHIADRVMDKLKETGLLTDIFQGLAFAAATKVDPTTDRSARSWRMLTNLINHTSLRRFLGFPGARQVYEALEGILGFDYHYFLQRGSLEAEVGDVRLGEQFLGSAKSLAPDDYRVTTAYGLMLMRKAWENPTRPNAADQLDEGLGLLENVILLRGDQDYYPFHVIGKQGLEWSRRSRSIYTPREVRDFLERILEILKRGRARHPTDRELAEVTADVEREVLLTVVPTSDH